MQTTSLKSLALPNPFSTKFTSQKPALNQKKRVRSSVLALKRDADHDKSHYNGKLVDQNMIILRMRIHEMEAAERMNAPPSNWTEKEKQFYKNYDSDVLAAVGFLQTMLMDSRPSLVLGTLLLLMISGSMSLFVAITYLMEIVRGLNI